jgi:hypothetical protein
LKKIFLQFAFANANRGQKRPAPDWFIAPGGDAANEGAGARNILCRGAVDTYRQRVRYVYFVTHSVASTISFTAHSARRG